MFVLFLVSLAVKLLYLLGIFLFHSWDRPALLTTSLLELLWLCYIEFGMLHFCFNLSLRMFWFLLWFLWWPLCCSVTSCLISTYLWIFLFFSFDWFLVSYYFGQRRHLILFENSWIFLRFVLWTNMYSSWRIFYMPLKRMCILLLLNKMFCSFLVAQMVKNLPTMWEAQVWFLGQEDLPGEGNSNPFQ